MNKKIKIAIADDHKAIRKGIIALLEDYYDIEVVTEASNGKELPHLVKEKNPDVVIVDIDMPELDGIGFLDELKKMDTDTRTLMFSMHVDDEMIIKSIEHGAHGYLTKDSEAEDIYNAIISINDKGVYFTDKANKALMKKLTIQNKVTPKVEKETVLLSEREIELIKLLSEELNSTEIASKMNLGVRTIEGLRSELLKKIGVKNTIGIVMYGVSKGLLK